MSKLDDITVDFGYSVGSLSDAPEAKQQIKQLMLELIGDDALENDPYDINKFQNILRDELRQKVNEL